jgi:hypothetical protein
MSVHCPATIDCQRDAGGGGSGVAAQKYNRVADLLDGHKAFGRLLGQKVFADHLVTADAVRLSLCLDLLLNQGRPDITRTHRVTGHAMLCHLQRNDLGQSDDAMLGGDIG